MILLKPNIIHIWRTKNHSLFLLVDLGHSVHKLAELCSPSIYHEENTDNLKKDSTLLSLPTPSLFHRRHRFITKTEISVIFQMWYI